jgi:hypothetical protein
MSLSKFRFSSLPQNIDRGAVEHSPLFPVHRKRDPKLRLWSSRKSVVSLDPAWVFCVRANEHLFQTSSLCAQEDFAFLNHTEMPFPSLFRWESWKSLTFKNIFVFIFFFLLLNLYFYWNIIVVHIYGVLWG